MFIKTSLKAKKCLITIGSYEDVLTTEHKLIYLDLDTFYNTHNLHKNRKKRTFNISNEILDDEEWISLFDLFFWSE